MIVILLNSNEIYGGAARATHRLYKNLLQIGIDVKLLVQDKSSDDPCVINTQQNFEQTVKILKRKIGSLPLKRFPNRKKQLFSVSNYPSKTSKKILGYNPDIVHLHWVCHNFLSIKDIGRINIPIVWTLHDFWPFTGGCHYPGECLYYTNSCGQCPILNSNKKSDFSNTQWKKKKKYWKNLNLTIVTPSNWLGKIAKESSLLKNFPVKIIHNGIDLTKFKPINKNIARTILGVSKNKRIILFGALKSTEDKRKGYYLLIETLKRLKEAEIGNDTELIVFGTSNTDAFNQCGFKVTCCGTLNDDISLSLLYCAADVMVIPSLQDNLPNTGLEALACGTPVVSFAIGGLPDIVEHEYCGYLAKPFDTNDLAQGINWILKEGGKNNRLAIQARKKAEKSFDISIQAKKYQELYKSILTGREK